MVKASIYSISSKNKVYIGMSINPVRRYKQHLRDHYKWKNNLPNCQSVHVIDEQHSFQILTEQEFKDRRAVLRLESKYIQAYALGNLQLVNKQVPYRLSSKNKAVVYHILRSGKIYSNSNDSDSSDSD